MGVILIIEDNDLISVSLKRMLQLEKFEVIQAKDGRDAIDLLKYSEFDLIISDIMMPYTSGIEVLDFVRNELNSNIPFIMLSGATHEQLIAEALNKGADDFMTKPFSTMELLMRVKRLLRIKNRLNLTKLG